MACENIILCKRFEHMSRRRKPDFQPADSRAETNDFQEIPRDTSAPSHQHLRIHFSRAANQLEQFLDWRAIFPSLCTALPPQSGAGPEEFLAIAD